MLAGSAETLRVVLFFTCFPLWVQDGPPLCPRVPHTLQGKAPLRCHGLSTWQQWRLLWQQWQQQQLQWWLLWQQWQRQQWQQQWRFVWQRWQQRQCYVFVVAALLLWLNRGAVCS